MAFKGVTADRAPWAKLRDFLRELKACAIAETVLLDGSFVSGKTDPNDIPLIVVVPAPHDFSADLFPLNTTCSPSGGFSAATDSTCYSQLLSR